MNIFYKSVGAEQFVYTVSSLLFVAMKSEGRTPVARTAFVMVDFLWFAYAESVCMAQLLYSPNYLGILHSCLLLPFYLTNVPIKMRM